MKNLFFFLIIVISLSSCSERKLLIDFNSKSTQPAVSYRGKAINLSDPKLKWKGRIKNVEVRNPLNISDLTVRLDFNSCCKEPFALVFNIKDNLPVNYNIKNKKIDNSNSKSSCDTIGNPSPDFARFPFNINFNRPKDAIWSQSDLSIKLKQIKKDSSFMRFDFLFEEDFLLEFLGLGTLNKDRDYSGGFSFVFTGDFAKKAVIISPIHNFLDRISFINISKKYNNGKYEYNNITNSNIKLGGSAFTPMGHNLRDTLPVLNDRPFASIVYISHTNQYISTDEKSSISTDFVFGMIGLKIMGDLQEGIHRWNKNGFKSFTKEPDPKNTIVPYYPKGWKNQISYEGEPTLLYSFTNRKLIAKPNMNSKDAEWYDFSIMRSVNVGYYNNMRFGGTLRMGQIKQKWYQFSSSPTGAIQAQAANSEIKKFCHRQFYWFLSGRANLVVYNALMQGQFRSSIYTLKETEIHHVIFEGETGLFWQPTHCSAFTLTIAARTPDFKTPLYNSPHLWACIYYTKFIF